jgi:trigger factor
MKVQVEEISPIERKLSIEVEPDQVEEELKRAYLQLSRKVRVPGFRPGKTPRRILEQKYRQEVEDDVVQRVVQLSYLKAIQDKNVEVVSNPRVTNDRLKPGQPFSFEARVEVKPKVDPKDYKGLELKRVDPAVPESKVDERLEQMRNRMARLEPLTGREVAQAKDYAVIDYEATQDGRPFPGSTAENVTVEVAPGEIVESNIAALEGVKVGESKEIDYAFPTDYHVESLRGKVAHFKIVLKGLKVQVTPELNDELAKDLGGGQTLAEMRAKVRKELEASAKAQAEQDERDALLNALVAKNPLEVPKAMVERAVDMMLEGALRSMARSGVDPRTLRLDFTRLRDEMRERATLEVKGSLLLEAIAQKESISATEADIQARVDKLAADAGSSAPQVRQHYKSTDERRGLGLRLREDKTVEFLKGQSKPL